MHEKAAWDHVVRSMQPNWKPISLQREGKVNFRLQVLIDREVAWPWDWNWERQVGAPMPVHKIGDFITAQKAAECQICYNDNHYTSDCMIVEKLVRGKILVSKKVFKYVQGQFKIPNSRSTDVWLKPQPVISKRKAEVQLSARDSPGTGTGRVTQPSLNSPSSEAPGLEGKANFCLQVLIDGEAAWPWDWNWERQVGALMPVHKIGNFITARKAADSLSHPCANIFTHFPNNILPEICAHHLGSHDSNLQSTEILQQIAVEYSGVVTPWTYWGTARTPFPDPQEDGDLNSANFNIVGYPKVWIFKNAAQTKPLQKHFKG